MKWSRSARWTVVLGVLVLAQPVDAGELRGHERPIGQVPGGEEDEVDFNDRDPQLWQNGQFFEGDIRASYKQVSGKYGRAFADELVSKGVIDPPPPLVEPIGPPGQGLPPPPVHPIGPGDGNGNGDGDNSVAPSSGEDVNSEAVDVSQRWSLRDTASGQVIVPYDIPDGLHNFDESDLDTIQRALDGIMAAVPAIKFVPRDSSHRRWIQVKSNEAGCWSYVGSVFSGAQPLNLQNPGCVYLGTVQHEFMHALGLYHEQSRPDRDDFVTIEFDKIQAGKAHNFRKHMFVKDLGVAYDLNSVMHYSKTSFGKWKVSCTAVPQICNQAAEISFVGAAAGDSLAFCIDGSGALSQCDGSQSQQFYLKAFGHAVEIRKSGSTGQCLAPPVDASGTLQAGKLYWTACDDAVDYHRFQIHGSGAVDGGQVRLKWEGHRYYCISRDRSSKAGTIDGTRLKLERCDGGSNQDFRIDLAGTHSEGCETYELCSDTYGTETTITAHQPIGQRSGISEKDALQLQLLYQCTDSYRNSLDELCSASCPCFEGFACSVDNECRSGSCDGGLCAAEQSAPTSSPTPSPARSDDECRIEGRSSTKCSSLDGCVWEFRGETERCWQERPICSLAPTEEQCDPSYCTWASGLNACLSQDTGSGGTLDCQKGKQTDNKAKCQDVGLQLCTKSQILNGEGLASSCGSRKTWTWTSTSCGNKNFIMVREKDGQTQCMAKRKKGGVQCCSAS